MDYDGPPRDEPVEETTYANYVVRAVRVFAIHMATLIIVCLLIGIFWRTDIMWGFGGFTTFFMTGWHLAAIENARDKQDNENYYE